MKLIPLTIYHPTDPPAILDFYTSDGRVGPRAATADGPNPSAAITRTRGDLLPQPATVSFTAEITAADLTAAYTAARAIAATAKGAIRVTYYAGAFNVATLTRYSMEPAGPDSVTLNLEFLPTATPTHYGLTLPTDTVDGWSPYAAQSFTDTPVINTSPALPRPDMRMLQLRRTGAGAGYYGALRTISGAPYDPSDMEFFAIARATSVPAAGDGFGILAAPAAVALYVSSTHLVLLNRDAYATLATAAMPALPAQAGEYWAFRLRITRETPARVRYFGKAWSRRSHPNGEPAAWQVTATRNTPTDPTFTGPYYTLPIGHGVDVAMMTTGTGAAPAPSIRL